MKIQDSKSYGFYFLTLRGFPTKKLSYSFNFIIILILALEKFMVKMHQLLAVDSSMRAQANKVRLDTASTFDKKRHLFSARDVTFFPLAEDAIAVKREETTIQTTVKDEVDFVCGIVVKAINSGYAIDIGNLQAKADIVLDDGHVIFKDVPATALLQLEKRLREIEDFAKTIPTLDPAKGFKLDLDQGKGVYAARANDKLSTKKEQKPLVLYPATDKHPAQVQVTTEDIPIGRIQEKEWSSLTTPLIKSEILIRIEDLIRAVSSARARANEQEVDVSNHKIGAALLDYVFKPLEAAQQVG